jgi:diguanylate cyclase (GGDEF)-like protein
MKLTNRIFKMSKLLLVIMGIIFILIIYLLDYLTGYKMSFSIFYIPAIALIAWYVGRFPGFLISALSALLWLWADIASGHKYDSLSLMTWNTLMRFLIFIIISYLVSENKKLFQEHKDMSLSDSLTGISNGRHFYTIANKEIERACRFKESLTVAYFDIDNFKEINDQLGHNEGDNLLKIVALTTKSNIRSIDAVARLGGDEFAILFPNTNYEQSKIALEKIKKLLTKEMEKRGWSVTFSFGSVTSTEKRMPIEELVKIADDLMYLAKNNGKNSIKSTSL